MPGVRKTNHDSGIIRMDPDAISRTIHQGVRKMERDPGYRRALTLRSHRSVQPPVSQCSELGRRARLFGPVQRATQCLNARHGSAHATTGRRTAGPQPSLGLAYELVRGTRYPQMIMIYRDRAEVAQALRRGEIQADTLIRIQESPQVFYDIRAGQLMPNRGH